MRRILAAFLAVLLAAAGVYWFRETSIAEEKVRRANCFSNLGRIRNAISEYQRDNQQRYPENLQQLYPRYLTYRRFLTCPSDHEPEREDSYSYEKPVGPITSGTVLVREKPGNHRAQGSLKAIQMVLYCDGTVRAEEISQR